MTGFLLGLEIGGTIAGDLLKAAAMRRVGEAAAWTAALARAFASPLFWLGIGGYALSFFGFLGLLSRTEVSFAVPATAAGYVVETSLAAVLLRERVSARRWAGAALVICGVAMVGG